MKKATFRFLLFLLSAYGVCFFSVHPVQAAGNDLHVSCTSSVCTVAEGDVPLFNETNIIPGQTFTRKITAKNNSAQSGAFAVDGANLVETNIGLPLAEKIKVVIRRSSLVGDVVYGSAPRTLQNLIDDGYISLGSFAPGQQDDFFVTAAVLDEVDNQYQGLSSVFDLDLGFEFIPNPTPTATIVPNPTTTNTTTSPSSNNSGGSGSGGSSSSNSVCTDKAPTARPTLTLSESSTSDGQVTLQWTAVSGATTYAINFGTQPGVYLYGNNNVGNQTSYTVTNLVPGNNYYFQVLGINGCAPGPRSNEVSTGGSALGLGATVSAPSGFTPQQVLGVTTDATAEATVNEATPSGNNPQILGAIQEACQAWKPFLPLIIIVIQILISLIIYIVFRNPENKLKQVSVVVVICVLTLIFYLLRNCDCSTIGILTLLCKWYFVLAIAVGLITQFINYALIEREE